MKSKFFKQRSTITDKVFGMRGFTMVELIISIGIFTLLSAMTLVKYNTFNNNAEFTNATEGVVLALRQAQVYGVAARSSLAGGGAPVICGISVFDCVYGVHFDKGAPGGVSIFIDENGNYVYDSGEKVVEVIAWKNPITIFDVQCDENGDCYDGKMDVTFRRPNPDGFIADISPCITDLYLLPICKDSSGNIVDATSSYKKGLIVLRSGDRFSTTTITLTGQISLK